MSKKFIYSFLLFAALSLSACAKSVSDSSSELESDTSESSVDVSESLSSEDSTSESSSIEESSSEESSSEESSSEESENYETIRIETNNITSMGAGNDLTNNGDAFINYFNQNYKGLLNSIDVDGKVTIQGISEEDGLTHNQLTIGSSSYGGSLTLNFAIDVRGVVVGARSYYKYIAYNDTYSMDYDATINVSDGVNTATQNLPDANDAPSQVIETELKCGEPVKAITIDNNDGSKQRVLVEYIEILY